MGAAYRARVCAVMVAGALVVHACSVNDPDASDPTATTTSADSSPDTTAPDAAAATSIAATPTSSTAVTSPPNNTSTPAPASLDSQLVWFLNVMNGAEPTADEYADRFGDPFTSQVSFDDFVGVLPQIRSGETGWVIAETDGRDDRSGSFVLAPAAGEPRVRLLIDVDPADAGQIVGLVVQPAETPELDDPPETFDEAVAQLADLGRAGVLVADVTSGECTVVDAEAADVLLPIGSAFKLYVLGAVAEAIDRGELTWDVELVFTTDLASFPSGVTQRETPGSALSVRELATRMISISDNTATDMLINAVGRDAVAAVQAPMGHGDPDANRPFLTTRELFVIKLDPELSSRYRTADVAARAAILDEIADRPLPELGPGDFAGDPIAVEQIEWFATPADLCRALVYLAERAEQPGLDPIRDVMTASPGIADARFEEIWFKGGSEPGVLATAWLVRLGDRTFTVTGAVVNPDAAFDETTTVLTFAAVRDLVR